MKLETRGVLAGHYRGDALAKAKTHAVEVDSAGNDVRVLCGEIDVDHMCDAIEPVLTCPRCKKRLRGRAARKASSG